MVPKSHIRSGPYFRGSEILGFYEVRNVNPLLLSPSTYPRNLLCFPCERENKHFTSGFASKGQCGASLIISRSGSTVWIEAAPAQTNWSRTIGMGWAPATARPAAGGRMQACSSARGRTVRLHMHSSGRCMHVACCTPSASGTATT